MSVTPFESICIMFSSFGVIIVDDDDALAVAAVDVRDVDGVDGVDAVETDDDDVCGCD